MGLVRLPDFPKHGWLAKGAGMTRERPPPHDDRVRAEAPFLPPGQCQIHDLRELDAAHGDSRLTRVANLDEGCAAVGSAHQ